MTDDRKGFPTIDAAHDAATKENRHQLQPAGRGCAIGWAIEDAPDGGFFARMGYAKGKSVEVWP